MNWPEREPMGQVKITSQKAVVDAIRKAILGHDLAPGQRLVEAELSAWLGASRGTVRAALMDLIHEGLVTRVANKGAHVRIVTLEEALHIAEVRLLVEGLCVEKAAEKATDEEIKYLQDCIVDLKRLAAENDVQAFVELSRHIRQTYVRIADQPVAQEMLERLQDRNARHRFRLTYRPGRAQASLKHWVSLIDAISRRDPKGARRALTLHVENVVENMKAVSEEYSRSLLQPIDRRHMSHDRNDGRTTRLEEKSEV